MKLTVFLSQFFISVLLTRDLIKKFLISTLLRYFLYPCLNVVKESAVHRLKTLDILISMAKKKGRRESIIAVGELCDLYDSVLALPHGTTKQL